MAIDISLRGDVKRLKRDLDAIGKQVLPQATQAALNKSMDKTYTETVREVGKVKNVRRKDLTRQGGKGGHIQKIPATKNRLISKVWVGLRSFVYRDNVSVKQKVVRAYKNARGRYTKGKPPQSPYSEVFTVTLPGGRTTTMVRAGGANRLPIKEVAVRRDRVAMQVDLQPEAKRIGDANSRKHAKTTFIKELKRQVEWRAAKLRARIG